MMDTVSDIKTISITLSDDTKKNPNVTVDDLASEVIKTITQKHKYTFTSAEQLDEYLKLYKKQEYT